MPIFNHFNQRTLTGPQGSQGPEGFQGTQGTQGAQGSSGYPSGITAPGVNSAYISTLQGTSSTTYADLATAGPAVTVTIGASGNALVIITGSMYGTTGTASAGFSVSGASTVAASDSYRAVTKAMATDLAMNYGSVIKITGLNQGSNTFTTKYKTSTGTANFYYRGLVVIPL